MIPPSPTEEIRAARHRLAAKFGNDLDRIVADLRRQQRESGREYITLSPEISGQGKADGPPVNLSSDECLSSEDNSTVTP